MYDSVRVEEIEEGDANAKEKFDYGKWTRSRLPRSMLVDMFHRYDLDQNGRLELIEFLDMVNKLRITSKPSVIADVFSRVDKDGNGWLDIDEFVSAYDLLYDAIPSLNEENNDRDDDECFIWALRYGYDIYEEREVYEMYRGNMNYMYDKVSHYADGTIKVFDLERKSMSQSKQPKNNALESNSLHHIGDLLQRDKITKIESSTHNVKWFVDVAYKSHVIPDLTRAFKMNKQLEPQMYTRHLDDRSESRITLVESDTTKKNSCDSLSLFIETFVMKNYPIINISDAIPVSIGGWTRGIMRYVMERMAVFSSFSSWTDKLGPRMAAISHARSIAKNLREVIVTQPDNRSNKDGLDQLARSSIPSVKQKHYDPVATAVAKLKKDMNIPVKERILQAPKAIHRSLSVTDLNLHPPSLDKDAFSIHLLRLPSMNEDADVTSVDAIIVYSHFDDEKDIDRVVYKTESPSESNSIKMSTSKMPTRTGVVGRILDGIRERLKQVVLRKGQYPENMEIYNSIPALTALIVENIHTFNEKALEDVKTWLDILDREMSCYVLPKHYKHLKEAELVLKMMLQYVQPIEEIIQRITKPTDETSQRIFQFLDENMRSDCWEKLITGSSILKTNGTQSWRRRIKKDMQHVKVLRKIYNSLLTYQFTQLIQYLTLGMMLGLPALFLSQYFSMNFDDIDYSGEGATVFWKVYFYVYLILWSLIFHFRLFQ